MRSTAMQPNNNTNYTGMLHGTVPDIRSP